MRILYLSPLAPHILQARSIWMTRAHRLRVCTTCRGRSATRWTRDRMVSPSAMTMLWLMMSMGVERHAAKGTPRFVMRCTEEFGTGALDTFRRHPQRQYDSRPCRHNARPQTVCNTSCGHVGRAPFLLTSLCDITRGSPLLTPDVKRDFVIGFVRIEILSRCFEGIHSSSWCTVCARLQMLRAW